MAFSIQYWANFVAGTKKLQTRSETAIRSNHVLTFKFDSDLKVIRSDVQASMRDKSYKVTITLGDGNTVSSSSCECPNGQDKCHHKATVLLYGYQNVSKTSVRQTWVKNPKSVPPKQTRTMEELFPAPPKLQNYRAIARDVEEADIAFFYDRLTKLGRFSAMHWMLSPEPAQPTLCVPLVEDLLLKEEYVSSPSPVTWLRSQLMADEATINQVVSATLGQRSNCTWVSIRKYRLTASNFGVVLSAIGRNRFPPSLFKRLCSAYNLDKKDAIIWGVTNEVVALQKYTSFGDAVVENTGLWLHSSGVLGASPDGIIRRPAAYGYHHQNPTLAKLLGDANLRAEVLEIKCPYSARNMTVLEAVRSIPTFCLELYPGTDSSFRLKKEHDYYQQIQGQLYFTNKKVCDLIVWTTKDCAIVRIVRDSEWQANISKLIDFYFLKFIKHIEEQ